MSADEYEYDYSDEDDEDYPVVDSDDDMEWNHTEDNPNAAPVMMCKAGIRMLPSDEIKPEMKRRLKDVIEILDIPSSAAAVLLREHKWSKEILLEKYYAEPEKLARKYGVYFRLNPVKLSAKSSNNACTICYEDQHRKIGMPCGHEFCLGCWREFSINAIAEGPSCIRKTCPQDKCTELITEDEIEKSAKDFLPKFESYQLRSFVESSTLTRWCPGRGCERIACASSASAMEQEGSVAHCDKCYIGFCIACGEEPHSPCSCKELARWSEKCRNESETANWILANTKSCPKCSSRIEKNQGCNHMTCQKCKYEFCWICMGDWSQHGANTGGYYKCNKFHTSNDDDSNQSDAAKARRELDRYLHYYKRYHAHAEAQAFAKKQLKETETRMIVLQESSDNARWSDVEFLKTANEQLIECRRVLKYTYTFAYYMTDVSKRMQKECFEYHQEMLEKFTENLSELSEKPLADMNRTDVVNQTRVVDRFMKNILKYVEDGMEDVDMPVLA
mmetsp:Transcript_36092/g.51066  ORF Transcript_36092/g.51066 Transcript_36092/m.51066 type:complete len:503 (-) Transcript_36092:263-1771(-)|eukprot:CAMPEP_0202473132 /NCGR_PEP_ID=MMETSP1360-20130828/89985_1 /ASSEMBLY_ACC=CAM_ASM_000848 /TAXON_ID=515479 /ORGANISM="Licmophora paradoxa, Strain CCMP2313" /LENGTH=502 /DNA_ID=CAMNT_0049099903 /DNA_START=195 /DNA_END=1703 /DNA_ORIENTATION=+